MADIRTEQARRQRRFFRLNGGQGVRALVFLQGDKSLSRPMPATILLRRAWRPTERAAEASWGASVRLVKPEIDFLLDAIPGGSPKAAQNALVSVAPGEAYRLLAAADRDVAKITFESSLLGENDYARVCEAAGLDTVPVPDDADAEVFA